MTAVLVTRPAGPGDPVARALRARGLRVHAVPTVATQPVVGEELARLRAAIGSLAAGDWLVVTSPTGARIVLEELRGIAARGEAGPAERSLRWASVGTATASVLTRTGIDVEIVPDDVRAAGLLEAFRRRGSIDECRVLLASASAASDDLAHGLGALGASVEAVVAYRTVEGPSTSIEPLVAALDDADLEAIAFASGSAVRGLVALAGPRADRARALPAVSIGPSTTRVARANGFDVVEARERSANGLVEAVVARLDARRPAEASAIPTGDVR